jgi:hypothetical protein
MKNKEVAAPKIFHNTPGIYVWIIPNKIIQQATRVTYDSATLITSYIESGFQKRLKTGVVFVDLTAAYDTVWKDGLVS